MRKKKFVFGLGTGCCGTASLAYLLNGQDNAFVGHELGPVLPWDNEDKAGIQFRYDQLNHQAHLYDIVGDVGLYYLSYVEFLMYSWAELLRDTHDIKFVALKREKEKVIRSFQAKFKKQGNNPLQNHNGTHYRKDEWDETFPKYDGVTLDQALSMYYDSYYKKCSYYEKRYPNHFKVFDIDSLNTVVGVNSILNFVDVKNKKVLTGITKNVTNANSE